MYEETGIFVAICRHGFVIIVCDMVRSGELAKYPIAIVNKVQKVYEGRHRLAGAYDIWCSFKETLNKSTLGPQLKKSGLDGCVPAWHGYAHNRLCQLSNHPLYREGFGMNDFEGCERLFSSTNGVARCTRHASSRYRHRMLCAHFEQWDEDKYHDLSSYLLRHYKEALGRQTALTAALSKAEALLGVHSSDFDGWLAEEHEYLQNLVKEPVKNVQDIAYIELLAKYYQARYVYISMPAGLQMSPADFAY
ncbi:hypothetical protein BOTBODRAFT_103239 [Botryobasidium botryosum FD-172 SS1]|uniref:Uncharacterized protein n=1 Tax=Botryobasidium botryosum (strain FD-172 SS1) TaxID=930990 RepID=A0A067N4R0_BOTB1|nr:hypothetical protein BOTBODRAFT_103239 [Botryobasidium botryosum FD-172 SS1]